MDLRKEIANQVPYRCYQSLLQTETPIWDEGLNAWLVSSFTQCSEILRDEDTFSRVDRHFEGSEVLRGNNPRGLQMLEGETHDRLHRMLSRLVDRHEAGRLQSLIETEAFDLVESLRKKSRADLAAEYADRMPVRVGLRLMGIPSDEPTVDEVLRLRAQIAAWDETMGDDPGDTAAAKDAASQLHEIIMPTIRARQRDRKTDLTSELWEVGPAVFPDWNELDSLSASIAFVGGGEVQYLLRNLIYLLAADPELQRRVRSSTEEYVPRLVDEAIRTHGPVHWVMRLARRETKVADVSIKKGNRVLVLLGAANRDSRRYKNPDEIKLSGRRRPNHLGFGIGRRFCIGYHLALAETRTGIAILLQGLREIRLDVGVQPALNNFHIRSYQPLHATYSPA